MLTFYSITILTSAFLIFWLEPMYARMVLPSLGGSPGVWNTAMVFYQAALLAGYFYVHLTSTWLGAKRQSVLHLLLLLVSLAFLPIVLPEHLEVPADINPVFWLLGLMTLTMGLPFLVLSATAPLLQYWFAHTRHPYAQNPYMLYSASNLGSMMALIGYPLLITPLMALIQQQENWALLFILATALLGGCAFLLWKNYSPGPAGPAPGGAESDEITTLPEHTLTWKLKAKWLLLAFVPSSLLLGVTTHITTDVASVPLLWVLPLALYLLSFVIVFSRRPLFNHEWMLTLQPFLLLPFVLLYTTGLTSRVETLGFIWELLMFFTIAMVCHGELVRLKPPAHLLTHFYLYLSIGGVLGGIFNAIAAPLLFDSLIEYPLVLALACVIRPAMDKQLAKGKTLDEILPWSPRTHDFLIPAAIFLMLAASFVAYTEFQALIFAGIVFSAALIALKAAFEAIARPGRMGAIVIAILLAGTYFQTLELIPLYQERNFFGISKVREQKDGTLRVIEHGTTIHGMQLQHPDKKLQPASYYHSTGPFGLAFETLRQHFSEIRMGVVGLGAGVMACMLREQDTLTYYEIDPAVIRIAGDPSFFTFLSDCPADTTIITGDGRMSMKDEPDAHFDVITVDAFSSDAIPVHLLTREAVALYFRKLKPDGVLVLHLSNRYLELRSVVAAISSSLGIPGLEWFKRELSDEDIQNHASPALVAALSRNEAFLNELKQTAPWQPLSEYEPRLLWTDNYASIVRVLKW